MSVGYQGYGKINGQQFLVTSLSFPNAAVRIDSSSGWGGLPLGSTKGIDSPRTYDWSTNDGSISYEMALGMGPLIKNWILNRSTSRTVEFRPCSGGFQSFDCWWTSMSLTAAEGQAILGDISFMSIFEGTRQFGSQYISDRIGIQDQFSMEALQPLNPSTTNIAPVPFWKSTISGAIVNGAEPISWTLNFTQDLQKIFACEGLGREAQPPIILGIGAMQIELQVELFVIPGNGYEPLSRPGTAVVNMGNGTTFTLGQLELQNYAQDLKGQNDIATVSLTYQVYSY